MSLYYHSSNLPEDYFRPSMRLIRYGQMLSQLSSANWLGGDLKDGDGNKILLDEIHKSQQSVMFYFDTEKEGLQASIRKWIREPASKTNISIPRMTITAYLAFQLLLNGQVSRELSDVISCCTVDDLSPLSLRAVIGIMLVEGSLRVFDDKNSSLVPRVGLSYSVIEAIYNKNCIPLISEETISDLKTKRKVLLEKARKIPVTRENEKQLKINANSSLKDFIAQLPLLTPQQLFDELGRLGYIGQVHARRSVCLAVYRFISRLKKIHIEGMSPKDLPPVGNLLLKGETGTGKSFMLKCLSSITGLPTLIEDITKYSETGYVGDEINLLVSRAYQLANQNIEISQACSVICIDEIDKISNPRNNYALVSRDGVSRSLLKLIEGVVTDIPIDPSDHPYRSKRVRFDTSNLMWIGIGCFEGMDELLGKTATLGFSAKEGEEHEEQISGSGGFAEYGFISQLLGRFTGGVIKLETLSREEMTQILIKNTLPKYERECEISNIELSVDETVYDLLITGAMKLKTGARGLTASLEGHLSKAMFSAYSLEGVRGIELMVSNGRIMGVVSGSGKKREVEPLEDSPVCAG